MPLPPEFWDDPPAPTEELLSQEFIQELTSWTEALHTELTSGDQSDWLADLDREPAVHSPADVPASLGRGAK